MAEGMKLSVVMPAQNEEGSVGATVEGVVAVLEREGVDYEVVVVNDDSEDSTEAVVAAIGEGNPRVRVHRSHYERGFGMAIRAGLDVYSGDAVAIVMADASDDPRDLVRYVGLLEEGWDCAFGSRFMPGAHVYDYPPLKLSVVMPAQNEEGSVGATVEGVVAVLEREGVDYEVVVVNDDSDDSTEAVVAALGERNPRIRVHRSHNERGFGNAIRAGLDVFSGDAVAIVMADASDDPEDLVGYHQLLEEGYDCAFGSRFVAGAKVHDYPRVKYVVNRLANQFIRILFRHHYNDTTNAFKAYRREVVETIQPLLSKHFNLTVEMPLKAIVRGHSYAVIPTDWTNRTSGEAKLAMKEMGSRYLFIVLYVWLEMTLSRGDYRIGSSRKR
jgi:glycosyltransferase involved in cell wall biosynthesis